MATAVIVHVCFGISPAEPRRYPESPTDEDELSGAEMSAMCCEVSLEGKYLRQIREILDRELGDIPARAFIFGSRARSGERESSDIDLAVEARREISREISRIRERLEESCIPYESDIVNLSEAGKGLREDIQRDGVMIWQR